MRGSNLVRWHFKVGSVKPNGTCSSEVNREALRYFTVTPIVSVIKINKPKAHCNINQENHDLTKSLFFQFMYWRTGGPSKSNGGATVLTN